MSHWSVSIVTLSLLLLWPVCAVRISPKLDFGESNTKPLSAGFRPETEIRYLRDSGVSKTSYRTEQTGPIKFKNIEVICVSGNCSTTKATTEIENGLSADVLVHIETNVDVAKIKNDTLQLVPDVPVVVGTKTSTVPAVDSGRPNPVLYDQNNPVVNVLPPLSINNAFIPTNRPSFVQNPQLQTDSQIRGYPGFNNYAPRHQGINNDVNLQTTYFELPFNGNNNFNNIPHPQQPSWRPKVNSGGTYNPVEFKKIYSNTWTPVKWSRSNPSNFDRRTRSGIPRWTPCVCQNSEIHRYPTTPIYPQQHGQPTGINGKLAPLI